MIAVTARVASAFDGLFDWWVQELREARASVAERYGSLRSPRFQLQLFGDHAVLARIGDATGEQQPFRLHENGLPPLDEVWTAERPTNARIDLVLPEADALVFHLQMPPMADYELKDAIELQLERKLPLAREHLYVDWITTQKNPDRSRTIAVAAARRARVDQWRDQLRPWAWRPGRVSCRDLDGTVRFNLLPRAIERVSLAFGRREALLAWGGSGLAVCYCLITAGQWTYERKSLAENIEEARTQVAGVQELRAILERESKPLLSVRQLTQTLAADSALATLSATLPENTWLYQTEINAIAPAAPVITLEGYAPSAASLVQVFEQAQQFEGIQLIEASAAESQLNRIKLKLQLRARP